MLNGREIGDGLFALDRKPNPVAGEFEKIANHYGGQPLLTNFAMGSFPGGLTPSAEGQNGKTTEH